MSDRKTRLVLVPVDPAECDLGDRYEAGDWSRRNLDALLDDLPSHGVVTAAQMNVANVAFIEKHQADWPFNTTHESLKAAFEAIGLSIEK